VEAGKMELDLEPVPVGRCSRTACRSSGRRRRSGTSGSSWPPGSELGDIRVDVRKVKQILYNLLSNAVKFTNDGGHVCCARRPSSARRCRPDVRDVAGPQLRARDSEFAEFLGSASATTASASRRTAWRAVPAVHQIDSGLARKFEGTGLGLAMVKLLAELHGGAVTMESAEGEGSVVTVWLPVRPLEGRRSARGVHGRAGDRPGPGRATHGTGGGGRPEVRRADPCPARGGGLHGAARGHAEEALSSSR
jgi:hypothetical protein